MSREENRSGHEDRLARFARHGRTPLTGTSAGGRILSGAQLPWFTLLPPNGFGVLTTTGRRTGKTRRKCLRIIRNGDEAYVVAIKGETAWLGNIRAEPRVKVRVRGGTFDGVAEEITDPVKLEQARAVYCGTVNRFDRAEYRVWIPGRPTPSAIRALHERWFTAGTPVAIRLRARSRARELAAGFEPAT